MTLRLSITRFRFILIFCAAIVFIFAMPPVFAQESPDELAEKHGITFPIEVLGGCTDYSSCRTYCEDPVHQEACIIFAKEKGFYKEEQVTAQQDFWQRTKAALGCDSEASCRQLCEQEANFDRCSAFAKKYSLSGGHTEDPSETQILEKAKQILGCTSYASCMNFCKEEANRQKCSDFAQEVGLRGGEHQAGPGGCTSEETCKAFCSDPNNYQICSQYGGATGGSFQGPGGCNSESSCRAYCEQHPQECQHFGGDRGEGYNPAEMCSKTPNCTWTNNACTCSGGGTTGDYEKFCQENPDKCSGSINHEDYCKQYPDKCTGSYPSNSGSQDSVTECAKYPGCSWTGSSCQCSNQSGSTDTNTQSSGGTSSSYDPATECSKQSGCSWNGSSCQCSNTSGSNPTESSQPQPSPGVQGVATEPSLLQRIWQLIFSR